MCPVCCLDVRLGLSAESKPLLLLLAENKKPKLVVSYVIINVFFCIGVLFGIFWGLNYVFIV